MGKFEKKKSKKPTVWVAILAAVLVIALAAAILLRQSGGSEEPELSEPDTQPVRQETIAPESGVVTEPEATEPPVPTVEFPLALEQGKLEINSLFSFDGFNPDCGDQDGKDIAAVTLCNTSDTYLAEVNLTLELLDGSVVHFAATDLPAGKTAMVFSSENASLAADAACVDVQCSARWGDTAVTESDQVAVSVSGTTITLTNLTDQDISELVIYCRVPLGEEYFGGITYQYTINDLPANGSTDVNAVDCILGMAEVVRIVISQE